MKFTQYDSSLLNGNLPLLAHCEHVFPLLAWFLASAWMEKKIIQKELLSYARVGANEKSRKCWIKCSVISELDTPIRGGNSE